MDFKKIILVALLGFGFLADGMPAPPTLREAGGKGMHDIHLSKCAITYVEDKNMLDIQWHIWLDDLAVGLQKFGAADLQLLSDNEAEGADEKLVEYLQTKMSISINGTPFNFSFKKKEASEDLLAVWVHLEVKNVASLKSIKIQNGLLMEVFGDQQNIVHVKGKDGRQGYLIFDSKGQEEEILF
ncbi:MAG TPA: hypothetical protein ENJ95_16760 [Bacteroidetes bacterium]|nr:hypothetical protein [Bacteroidota bacterium]